MARDARVMRIVWTTGLVGPGETKPTDDGPRVETIGRLREVA